MSQLQTTDPIPEMAALVQIVRQSSSKLRFPVYLSDALMSVDLSELELSVRSYNCLRRAGYETVGDLVTAISGSDDLKKIRNCGSTSVREIMSSLVMYQYLTLPPQRRARFLRRRNNFCHFQKTSWAEWKIVRGTVI